MVAKLEMTGNEAMNRLITKLTKGPRAQEHRDAMRRYLAYLEEPVTYSNQDVDRAATFSGWLIDDVVAKP